MKKLLMTGILAGAFIAPALASSPAEAQGYCREYTKTIVVGGHREQGYGTACLQPDGSWEIVSARGSVDPFDELRNRNAIIVSNSQPVYYQYGPSYRPVTYYAPRPHFRNYYRPYYRQPAPGFYFSFSSRDNDRWDRHDRREWDRDNDRHRGNRGGRNHR